MDLIRNMTPEERLRRAFELSELARSFATAGMRQRHPEASDREIFLLMAEQSLGSELYQKAYGASAR